MTMTALDVISYGLVRM